MKPLTHSLITGLRCFAELPNDNMGDLRSSKAIYNAPSGELEWKMLLDITSAKMTGMSSHIVQQARAARRDKVKQSRGLWRLEAHGKYWGKLLYSVWPKKAAFNIVS